ncbi:hypothetical protein VTO73DRAFT_12286 [Trametes versicolor]
MKTITSFFALAAAFASAFAAGPLVLNTPESVAQCVPTVITWTGGVREYLLLVTSSPHPLTRLIPQLRLICITDSAGINMPTLDDFRGLTRNSFLWATDVPAVHTGKTGTQDRFTMIVDLASARAWKRADIDMAAVLEEWELPDERSMAVLREYLGEPACFLETEYVRRNKLLPALESGEFQAVVGIPVESHPTVGTSAQDTESMVSSTEKGL